MVRGLSVQLSSPGGNNASARWGGSWRIDETYIKVKGVWKYLCRAVDREGKTVDFPLASMRDKAAVLRLFEKAMKASGFPEKITMDKSGATKAAMDQINGRGETPVIVRQAKCLNNIVEKNHRAVKRVTKPMLNFKSYRAAKNVLVGIELTHMIGKNQLLLQGCIKPSFVDQFYVLDCRDGLSIHSGFNSCTGNIHLAGSHFRPLFHMNKAKLKSYAPRACKDFITAGANLLSLYVAGISGHVHPNTQLAPL